MSLAPSFTYTSTTLPTLLTSGAVSGSTRGFSGWKSLFTIRIRGQDWRITAQITDLEQASQSMTMAYYCKKFIVSTRLATNPRPISIKGQEDFGRPILNHSQLRDQANKLAQDPTAKSVTIISTCKIGYDLA